MKNNLGIYILFVVLFGILIYNHFFFKPSAEPAPILNSLNDLQKEAISSLDEMVKLIISLSLALFGIIGFLATENYKSNGRIDMKYRFDLVIAFCCAAISIDFGYIFMEKWVEQLASGIFNPYDKLVMLPMKLQITSFLFSLLFTGRLIYRTLFKK